MLWCWQLDIIDILYTLQQILNVEMTGDKHINTINIAACSTAPWQLRGKLVMQHPDNATSAVKGCGQAKYTVLPLECRYINLLISTSVYHRALEHSYWAVYCQLSQWLVSPKYMLLATLCYCGGWIPMIPGCHILLSESDCDGRQQQRQPGQRGRNL